MTKCESKHIDKLQKKVPRDVSVTPSNKIVVTRILNHCERNDITWCELRQRSSVKLLRTFNLGPKTVKLLKGVHYGR